MKKYFAKYLPVDEEIKDGDWYYDYHLNVMQQKGKSSFDDRISFVHDDKCKKVKPFLCSRDIQVGDKVYSEEGWDNMKDGFILKKLSPHNKSFNESLYKIIGEISPEAIWVKDGNEFDETDIRYGTYKLANKNDIQYFVLECPKTEWFTVEEGAFYENDWHKCILIKGTCGHFH